MTIIGFRADRAVRGRAPWLFGTLACLAGWPAWADFKLNMPEGVTTTSHEVYDLHMLVLGVCTLIAIGVYAAMVYAIVKFRKSAGAKPAKFSHNMTIEVVWTVIPFLILLGMAWPRRSQKLHPGRNTSVLRSRSSSCFGSGSLIDISL